MIFYMTFLLQDFIKYILFLHHQNLLMPIHKLDGLLMILPRLKNNLISHNQSMLL